MNVGTLMFDFYGTVVDMQTGLTEALAPYLKRKGYGGPASRVVTWWRRTHFENSMIDALLHKEHTPYREIGFRALDYTLERAGVPHTDAEVRELVDAITRLRPFPDVPAALERLRSRYKLVVLSNGDPDMLASGVPYAGIAFDRVISVAEAGSFKPHVATYRKAAELIDAQPTSILFVANHAFDCIGAKAFGMRSAFIDRRARPFGKTPYQPDLVVRDFTSLAQALLQ
jgi:2-haloacid dehalogenase